MKCRFGKGVNAMGGLAGLRRNIGRTLDMKIGMLESIEVQGDRKE